MFRILKKSTKSKARLGVVQTAHGRIPTPFFMPDATRGVIKGLSSGDLRALGLEAAVINAYHLFLRPGMDIIKKAGGAHQFMNFAGPLCSDSGGYQAYSLIHKNPSLGKITDDKVIFRSRLDGSACELTPEKSIQIQFDLGADMIVCLDDCPPHNLPEAEMEKSVARTIAWAKRCRSEYDRQARRRRLGRNRPLIFAVIQGGTSLALRQKCAQALSDIESASGGGFSAKGGPDHPLDGAFGWDGYGLGARPVDRDGKFLSKIVSGVADLIPEDKLRFALGTGAPHDIVKSVKAGWDIFDCVIPTREARHGRLYIEADKRGTKRGFTRTSFGFRFNPRHHPRLSASINIANSRFARDFSPVNPNSRLSELRQASRAYLHHLFKTGEPQAGRLATLNNLEFYLDLMKAIRVAIRRGLL